MVTHFDFSSFAGGWTVDELTSGLQKQEPPPTFTCREGR